MEQPSYSEFMLILRIVASPLRVLALAPFHAARRRSGVDVYLPDDDLRVLPVADGDVSAIG